MADAGYSGTPLARKLGIKAGQIVVLHDAPADFDLDAPETVTVRRRLTSGADVTVAFVRSAAAYRRRLPRLVAAVGWEAALWIAWPRRAAGHRSDLTDNLVRAELLPTGLVDVKVAALGEDWSGLRFVWRRELRPR